jgi:catechol 2,3-dioxygenase-like lactoylglutathione lyase family enzyme
MSNTQGTNGHSTQSPNTAKVEMKLEVEILPVSDVDRAKRFYEDLGWRLDADFSNGPDHRIVQLTPPGSPCSILFGKGVTSAPPGSAAGLFLVVFDIEGARADLIAHGAEVSEVFHFDGGILAQGTEDRLPGPDPQHGSYKSFASFSDPDGNRWLLQQVTERLPGRGLSNFDVPTMMELLREAEEHHSAYERIAPKHHWSTFYAGYIVAREQGRSREEATREAAQLVERSLH